MHICTEQATQGLFSKYWLTKVTHTHTSAVPSFVEKAEALPVRDDVVDESYTHAHPRRTIYGKGGALLVWDNG